jgi:hypothetical protein
MSPIGETLTPAREFVGIAELDQTRRIRRRKSGVGQRQVLADKIIGGSGAEIKDCCGRMFYRRQIGSGDQADSVDPGCPPDRVLLVGVGVFAVRATPDVRPALVLWEITLGDTPWNPPSGVCRYNCATPAREQSSSC